MRIYTKKLLTFLLVLALLLSSMNIILSVFAAETGVNLQLNGGTLQGSSEVYSAGDALPDSAMITRAGAAFGGWYTDADFTGDRIFTVPSDAAAGTTYYARWIYYSFDFVNFDSYDTDSDMTAVWLNWGTDVADYSLNSDLAHAASGKSMKIDIKQANTNADIVTQTYNNTKSGDGIAFWVESANGITVKFRFNGKSQYISQIKTVPAGKHFVMIPWSELGESLTTSSYLWQAEFFIKVPNADETVYIDDIGTYAVPNGITANWENGFTHSYDENGKTVWNYSKTADDSSYIGFATDYVLEKGKNYVIAFEYKYLKDGNLAWSLEPQAVGSAFDESEIMQQTDESKQTLNSKDRNSDWATKKIVFAADGENKYLGFFGKTEAGAEYDISIKNIRLYALGDVDFNGNIDTSDLASLKKSLLGAESIIEFADVNNDGKTDILDLISLKKMLAK